MPGDQPVQGMNTPARLAGFALILTAVLGVGYGAGAAVGPLNASTSTSTEVSDMDEHSTTPTTSSAPTGAGHGGHTATATPEQSTQIGGALGGLAPTDGGYTLVAHSAAAGPGPGRPFAFTITGPDGAR